jgi:putative transposase/transposase-like zinc-binding protein
MSGPRPTVAEVIRSCLDEILHRYGAQLTPEQRRALKDLAACRTAALGGHVLACPECGHQQIAYNSCGNRHCPTCRATAAARWLEAQAADLLPVPYFHLVFTLPDVLDPLALANPRVVYDLLLRCAAQTVLEVAANPKHLGVRTGLLTVLHTWGQNLHFHPHVHCVVPGGGLSPDRTRWVGSRPNFFLPVRVLSRVFRGKFLAGLRAAYAAGRLHVEARRPGASASEEFQRLLSDAARTDWAVYAKPPFGSPEAVLKYLARYTHRVAISNSRLLEFQDGKVRFRYKDYAHGSRKRVMTLSAIEFVRRLLLHVLPSGFVRIRHYGILSNRHRQESLALCRRLLGCRSASEDELLEAVSPAENPSSITPTRVCPACGAGRMIVIEELLPRPAGLTVGKGTRSELCVVVDSS